MRKKHCIRFRWLAFSLILAWVCAAWGQPGTGIPFDGGTAYTVPAASLELNPRALTLAAWVKLDSVDEPQVFMTRGAAGQGFTFYLFKRGVRMLVAHQPGTYTYALAPKPEPGEWTHYAGVYDGGAIRIYRNGSLAGEKKAEGSIGADEEDVVLGALDRTSRFVKGAMADLRIWNRALNTEEIAAVAAGEARAGLTQDMAGHWTAEGFEGEHWVSAAAGGVAAQRISKGGLIMNEKDTGYRGIWYFNQPSGDEYVYKYSGGLGTYCAKHIPHAWYAAEVNKTFFTYGGTTKDSNTRLVHMVSYYDHETGRVPRPTLLLDKETSDAHDNPVIGLDGEGYVWIFSSSHGTSRPSYISRSKEPYSIDAFELKWTGNYSYPQPWYLPGKGWLFMHTHYTEGRTIAIMTSPGAVDWSERRFLSRMDHGHYQISRPWDGRKVGSAFNYHPQGKGLNWRTNLYYMESDDLGETWRTVDGKRLEPMLTDPRSPALAVEYQSQGLNVYLKDINYDSKGNPVILYVTSKGYESGPENMPRTWTTARWTGTAWETQGGDIVSDNNYDTGSLYIESDTQWRIIGPTETGPQPYNPGGEVAMWLTRNRGETWEKVRQMTRNSDYNHTYVRRPVNAHPGFYAFWADGHGRQPSESRLYFCNKDSDVFRLPFEMEGDDAEPEKVN